MTEHYSFFDAVQDSNGNYDREYNAQQFTDYFADLITTGVMKGAFDQLEVTTNGTSMLSSLKTGVAFVEGKRYFNDSLLELTHDTEVVGLSRIDRIVIRKDSNTENRYVRAFVKKGTPNSNPVAPALTRNSEVYEISLAQILIEGGKTFIDTTAITDERGIDIICPWAGSKILPNFNNDALQELMQSQLTDGAEIKSALTKDANDLVENGFYFVSGSGKVNYPSSISDCVVQVLKKGDTILQVYYLTHFIDTVNIQLRMRKGGIWGEWQRPIPFENSITSSLQDRAATPYAVKQVNDKIEAKLMSGYGSPEGIVSAEIGTLYVNLNGGASTTLYVKTSGTGTIGWTAK